MAFGFQFLPKKSDYHDGSILNTLHLIKNGNISIKNTFIGDYKPFIKNMVKKTTEVSGRIEDSDEYSIALIAFNEAIDCYNEDKNCKFICFAEQVIRRRLLDYIKSNSKRKDKELPFSYFTDSGNNHFEETYFKDHSQSGFERIEIIQEIKKLVVLLKDFNIDIKDLPDCTPKHLDSRELSLRIAYVIVNNKELTEKLIRKKNIPTADVVKVFDVHPKTIQRNRKYIISLCLIQAYGLEHLIEFIGGERR